jgi:hypothetical protein
MDLATILVFITGLLTGIVAGLKIIAPRTKTTVDDKVLAGAEKALDVATGLGGSK